MKQYRHFYHVSIPSWNTSRKEDSSVVALMDIKGPKKVIDIWTTNEECITIVLEEK